MPQLTSVRCIRVLLLILAPCLLTVLTGRAFGIQTNYIDVNATVSPVVVAGTGSVTFTWDTQTTGVNVSISRRVMGTTTTGTSNTWITSGTVTHPTNTFTDSIADGTVYEYKIYRFPYQAKTGGLVGSDGEVAAFISVTMDAPIVHNRGTILLVVDQTFTGLLSGELAQLEMDMAGDGWTVQRINYARDGVGTSGTAPQLRSAIQAAYNADPGNVKAVYLFGRLPIARSGDQAPDGHNYRPEATDGYYGDMTGTWTDTGTYYDYTQSPAPVVNSPGDGIFDQVYYPALLSLMVGRVDLAGMSAYFKEETEMLRDYIHKSFAFRNGQRTEVGRTGLWNSGLIWMERNWLNPLMGTSNVTYATFKPTLTTTPYLFAIDFGNYDGSSTDYTSTPNKTVFCINFGSHKQDWDQGNNTMRAILAQPDWGLTCCWGARPAWFFHHMAAGLPVGYSALRTLNNSYPLNSNYIDYYPNGDYDWLAGYVTTNFLGDPTLRLDPVVPPSNVAIAASGVLTWIPSTDVSVTGYHVYRSSNRLGPYTCLTSGSLVSGTTYQDSAVPAGDVYYQVRAVKTETHTGTSYTNTSQGAFAKLKANGTANHPPVALGSSIAASTSQLTEVTLTGTDADGDTLTPIVLTNPVNGKLRWNGNQVLYMPAVDTSGTDSVRFVMSDGVTTSAPATLKLTLNPSNLLEWRFASPAAGVSQTMTSSTNTTGIQQSTLSVGPSVSFRIDTAAFQDDAVCLNTVPTGSLNTGAYLQWTVAPVANYQYNLDRVSFALWNNSTTYPVNSELHWSTDGFVSSNNVVQIGSSNQMTFPGLGSANNAGRPYSGNLSSISALQGLTSTVTFRLYFWYPTTSANCGIGKLGGAYPSLIVSGSARATYAGWAAGIGWRGRNSTPTGNPMNDGISNLMKYATGLNPRAFYKPASLPQCQVQTVNLQNYLTCTFVQNTVAMDLTYSVEVSSDLTGPWTPIDPLNAANQVSVSPNTPSTGYQTITVKDTQATTASDKRFMRLKVTCQ